MNNGTRTLLVDYILKKLTGEQRYLSREEIASKIEKLQHEKVSPNTIKHDIESIQEFNEILDCKYQQILEDDNYVVSGSIQIESTQKKGNQVTKELFSTGELIILFKFIENCFYLNEDEKREIMQKVLMHSSLMVIEKYNLNNGFDESTHYLPSTGALLTINNIQKAIIEDLCLKFRYCSYGINNHQFERVESVAEYFIYPIRFVMDSNYMYVIGYDLLEYDDCYKKSSNKQLRAKNYRVDRMCRLQTAHKPKYVSESLSKKIIQEAKEQVNNNINGFGGDSYITLKLRIDCSKGIEKSVFKTFVDRFGRSIIRIDKHATFIDVTIENVLMGEGLIHYLFGFDKQITVLEPMALKARMIEIIKKMKVNYFGE